MARSVRGASVFVAALVLAACSASANNPQVGGDAITGNLSNFIDLSFDAELEAVEQVDPKLAAASQLLYLEGLLRPFDSNAQVHKAEITNAAWDTAKLANGRYHLKYHVSVPVGWDTSRPKPTTVDLALPRFIDVGEHGEATSAFFEAYGAKCTSEDTTAEDFWAYFAPSYDGCTVKDADLAKTTAQVSAATNVSNKKYPEYDRIWADGQFQMVVIYMKDDGSSTSASDLGVADRNRFLKAMAAKFPGATTVPASWGAEPDGAIREFGLTSADGKFKLTTLLVDAMTDVPQADPDDFKSSYGQTQAEWVAHYNDLTKDADLLEYAGHSELGKSINAFADLGQIVPGKFQIYFFDGCNTYAYLDNRLVQRRVAANPDDPTGAKYMDLILNVTNAPFATTSNLTLVDAMLGQTEDYNTILSGFKDEYGDESSQHAIVDYELDNTFVPASAK
jgi:hypothetical protein